MFTFNSISYITSHVTSNITSHSTSHITSHVTSHITLPHLLHQILFLVLIMFLLQTLNRPLSQYTLIEITSFCKRFMSFKLWNWWWKPCAWKCKEKPFESLAYCCTWISHSSHIAYMLPNNLTLCKNFLDALTSFSGVNWLRMNYYWNEVTRYCVKVLFFCLWFF